MGIGGIKQRLSRRTVWSLGLVLWMVSVAAAVGAGVFLYEQNRTRILNRLNATLEDDATQLAISNLYNIEITSLSGPFEGRDGGIEPFESGILVATRTGRLWFVARDGSDIHPVDLTVPVNVDAFEAEEPLREVRTEYFGVKDILLRPEQDELGLYASYNYWNEAEHCATFRLAKVAVDRDVILGTASAAERSWQVLFETHPCMPVKMTGHHGFAGLQSGGRIVSLSDSAVLLSVGDFEMDGVNGENYPQDPNASYGKTFLIEPATGRAEMFTLGHRNPQGLTVDANGAIWLTEHGPRGGDELNLLVQGANYGWPHVTIGTNYRDRKWPMNIRQGWHDGYTAPVYTWVPSIAVSNLISVKGELFKNWRGDLLVASLKGRTLYRLRLLDGRVVAAEPILQTAAMIRDLAEADDGTIVFKTDNNRLHFLRPVEMYRRRGTQPDPLRGELLSSQCSGCHTFGKDEAHGIGPNLWNVVGRPIGSVRGYAYSEALKGKGGDWTRAALRDFLGNPAAFASGTSMVIEGLPGDDATDLVAYLETLN